MCYKSLVTPIDNLKLVSSLKEITEPIFITTENCDKQQLHMINQNALTEAKIKMILAEREF